MRVLALVGESGSGKSHRAGFVAYENKCNYIIDDGLLIRNGHVVEGKSAKREKTAIASVRRAVFMHPEDSAVMIAAIKRLKVESILIVGTSVRMVDLIAQRLELPKISKYIMIRDIATEEEIKRAKYIRQTEGKHVIPVAAFELKKDFSGYFMDSLNILFKRGNHEEMRAEKTIVRPTYSYMGDYVLTRSVVAAIAQHETNRILGVTCRDVRVFGGRGQIKVEIDIDLTMGTPLRPAAKQVQKNVTEALENYAALSITTVDVKILSIKPK